MTFTLECLLDAQQFDALEKPFYVYRRSRAGSATYESNTLSYCQRCMFVTEWADRLTHRKKVNDRISAYAMAFVAYEYAILLWKRVDLEKDAMGKANDFLQEYKWVMRYARNQRIRIIHLTEKLLGLKWTSLLLEAMKRHSRIGV